MGRSGRAAEGIHPAAIAVLTHRYLQNPFHGGDYYDARYNKRNQVVPLIVEALLAADDKGRQVV